MSASSFWMNLLGDRVAMKCATNLSGFVDVLVLSKIPRLSCGHAVSR